MSLAGVQRMDNYGNADPWGWGQQQPNTSPSQTYPAIFEASLYQFAPPAPQNVQPRHYSMATSHAIPSDFTGLPHAATPPPPPQQPTGSLVKAQPAFKPTWRGFLDTTKDAMTIVEAALQGRLSHIGRRPHDKERAQMLTSGTVLVYEENASGIKRWTDAVHWSPSRVMNNCLIYRQLVRALKPEEKKTTLNPSCGTKRKRKESASPTITNTGESIHDTEDEYEDGTFETVRSDAPSNDSRGKGYADFAQSMTPDQQRRYCGSLIDSYEFKEGGLMKKTISVKYQGTHHHIISYYSLEDVVSGKLKRPFQDPKLADIVPRPELLTGWKVKLEDEESKEMALISGDFPFTGVGAVSQGMPVPGARQAHSPLRLRVPSEYWHGGHVQHYQPSHHSPQTYAPAQQSASPCTQSPHHYRPPPTTTQHYPALPAPSSQYNTTSQSTPHYQPDQTIRSTQTYSPQHTAPQYPTSQHSRITQQPQYTAPQPQNFELAIPVPPQGHNPAHHPVRSPFQHDPQRRASAPVPMATYGLSPSQPAYQSTMPHQPFYMEDQKFPPGAEYGY